MSSITRPGVARVTKLGLTSVVSAGLLIASVAQAAVECPPLQDGHRLARLDGASLYQGDPANNMLLAPSHENPGGRGVNVWDLPEPAGIVLICRYDGSRTPVVINLPQDVHTCQQSVGAFSCK